MELPSQPERPLRSGAKVLVVCRHLGAASEVWLHRQIRALSRLTVEVLCWCRENEESYPLTDIPVQVMPFAPNPEFGHGRWWYRLRTLPGQNFYGAVGRERLMLQELMRVRRPDVLLCHYGHMALRMIPGARAAGVPLVVHFHGIDVSGGLRNPWYRWSLQQQMPHFAALVVVAEHQREQLLRLGADRRKIHVIPCGVPVREITPATQLTSQPCRFVAVGRLVGKKGPLETLRAFGRCAQRVPGATLTMIGDGPLLEAARQLRNELGLNDRVDFWGNQPSAAVLSAMHNASVFVQHSVTADSGDMEGWPVAIAEAMASGLPVVATRHAGIEQQVEEGDNGFLVDENDWSEMGDRMVQLAVDPHLRLQMGRRSRVLAEQVCDQSLLLRRLEAVLLTQVRHARRAPRAAGARLLYGNAG